MPWFEGAGSARLECDRAIVEELAPGLRFVENPVGAMTLVGELTVELRSGTRHAIPTVILFRDDYPNREPLVLQTPELFTRDLDHHILTGGCLCLWLDMETRWRPDDEDALRAIIDEVRIFYFRQLVWLKHPEGGYPGPARGHGIMGYLEYLGDSFKMDIWSLPRMIPALDGELRRPNRCPCGRSLPFRNCHRKAVQRFRERATPDVFHTVLGALDEIQRMAEAKRPNVASAQNA